MKKKALIATLIATFIMIVAGTALKIFHYVYAEAFLVAGLLATLVLLIVFGREALRSRHLTRGEKWMWLFSFTFFGWFAAVLFLLKYRKVLTNS